MDSTWPTIHSLRDCRNPSQIIWIVEENPGGYPPADGRPPTNDGYFRGNGAYNVDRAGTFHLTSNKPGTGKCNVVFLDGHGATLRTYPVKGPDDEFYKLYSNYLNFK